MRYIYDVYDYLNNNVININIIKINRYFYLKNFRQHLVQFWEQNTTVFYSSKMVEENDVVHIAIIGGGLVRTYVNKMYMD